MPFPRLSVHIGSELREQEAQSFAKLFNLTIISSAEAAKESYLSFDDEGIALYFGNNPKQKLSLKIDFAEGSLAHRRQFGGGKGQMIAKATGLSKGFVPHVLDVTAGLGKDAFVLASLGARVSMFERSPIVHVLLEDALVRAKAFAVEHEDHALASIINRMSLEASDAHDVLTALDESYDVVYLDPMFPERKKSAAVKKDMQIFHEIVGADEDADALLVPAIAAAKYRVVVKRPRIAPDLANETPSFRLEGKSSRFDIYTKKAFPIKGQ